MTTRTLSVKGNCPRYLFDPVKRYLGQFEKSAFISPKGIEQRLLKTFLDGRNGAFYFVPGTFLSRETSPTKLSQVPFSTFKIVPGTIYSGHLKARTIRRLVCDKSQRHLFP